MNCELFASVGGFLIVIMTSATAEYILSKYKHAESVLSDDRFLKRETLSYRLLV